jgi:hypothetical protein
MDNTNNENVMNEFKTPKVFFPIILLIIFLVICLFLILYKVNLTGKTSQSKEEITKNVLIVLFFGLIIFFVCVSLVPNFKDIKKIFEQISSVTYIIIYTIFLILFFRLVPSDTINSYAYIILPVTIALGALMFYKSASYSYVDRFDMNYERIKMMILLFCLITIFIIYYKTDPGGYISEYFGYSSLLTIIISVFAFLYLIIVLTLPDKIAQPEKGDKSNNFLNNFSSISVYGSLAFLIFLVVITIILYTYPGGFLNDVDTSTASIVLILIICILSSIILGANLFPEIFDKSQASTKVNTFKKSLLVLFGVIISGLIIGWIAYNIQHYAGQSSLTTLLLNLAIIVLVLGLIYKTINVKLPVANSNKNAFFSLLLNTVLYIPCIFSGFFDSIGKTFSGEAKAATTGSIMMLVTTILLISVYFIFPTILNKINLQGGKQLVNRPVYTDSLYSLGTYQDLNGSDTFDYQYAISFWVFIDSAPPNTNGSYSKFTSLLNFGNKPNVLYNGQTNTLKIVTQQKDLKETTNNKLIDFDEDGNRIIYRNKNMLLQKWNNIILNYNGGVLDIFLNGELVKSDIGVVPYHTLDNLTIGQDNGLKGGICNVVYFRHPLTVSNIYFLYKMVKDKTPPVINESNVTILKENVNTSTSAVTTVV